MQNESLFWSANDQAKFAKFVGVHWDVSSSGLHHHLTISALVFPIIDKRFGSQVCCKFKTKSRIKFFLVVVMLAMTSVHFTTNLMPLFCRGARGAKFSSTRVSGKSVNVMPETILPPFVTHAWLAVVGKVESLSPVLGISATKQVNDFSCFVLKVDKNWKEQFLTKFNSSFWSHVV